MTETPRHSVGTECHHSTISSDYKRRSEIREVEVMRLLAEGRLHSTPRSTSPNIRRPKAWKDIPASISSKSLDQSFEHPHESPSVGAKMRRDRFDRREGEASNIRPDPADLGEEYLHGQKTVRRWPHSVPSKSSSLIPKTSFQTPRSTSLDSLAARMQDAHLESPVAFTSLDPSQSKSTSKIYTRPIVNAPASGMPSRHRQNMHLALAQCRKQRESCTGGPGLSTELMEQLETVANLTDTVNQGLRRLLMRVLDARMGEQWISDPEDASDLGSAAYLDAELGKLLNYSDDNVRSMTDALLLILRERRSTQVSNTAFDKPSVPNTSSMYYYTPRQYRQQKAMSIGPTSETFRRPHDASKFTRRRSQPMAELLHEPLFPHAAPRGTTRTFSPTNHSHSSPLSSLPMSSLWSAGGPASLTDRRPDTHLRHLGGYDVD